MFTEQQKRTIRVAFGKIYNSAKLTHGSNLALKEMTVKYICNTLNTRDVKKVNAILNAMVVCGYMRKNSKHGILYYTMTNKGIERYESYLDMKNNMRG